MAQRHFKEVFKISDNYDVTNLFQIIKRLVWDIVCYNADYFLTSLFEKNYFAVCHFSDFSVTLLWWFIMFFKHLRKLFCSIFIFINFVSLSSLSLMPNLKPSGITLFVQNLHNFLGQASFYCRFFKSQKYFGRICLISVLYITHTTKMCKPEKLYSKFIFSCLILVLFLKKMQ